MHADRGQVHYAPSSVGALMDPTFLRNAVCDADGIRRSETETLGHAWSKMKDAVLGRRKPLATTRR